MFGFNPQAWEWLLASQVAQQQGNAGLAAGLASSGYATTQQHESGNVLSNNAAAIGAAAGTALGGAIGTVLLPGVGTASGAQMGAALGGSAGEASTGESDLKKLATVAALSGLGANVGGMLGSSEAVAAASGLTALGAGAGATFGSQVVSQDEVNAGAGPVEQTQGTPADAPGFTDIMKTDAQQEQENIQRRQQRLASGRKGTILTGTRGTANSAGNYQRKTLLGS